MGSGTDPIYILKPWNYWNYIYILKPWNYWNYIYIYLNPGTTGTIYIGIHIYIYIFLNPGTTGTIYIYGLVDWLTEWLSG
jgi:hypothetical protein